MEIDQDLLSGKTTAHLARLNDDQHVHKDCLEPLRALQSAAAGAGFDLQLASAFRHYDSQLKIWNAKARGERPIFDDHGVPVDATALSGEELIFAILRWSALPGASRHHWGTDFDVYDRKAVPPGYELQLSPGEARTIFGPLHEWLDANMAAFGFFRPYAADLGGVAPERWHLSYAPISQRLFEAYDFSVFWRAISNDELLLGGLVLKQAKEIYARYVRNIIAP